MNRLCLSLIFFCTLFIINAQGTFTLPGRIQAEDYVQKSDVATESTADEGGGLNVGYIDDGDWLDYQVQVTTAGVYTFKFRVANSYGNGNLEIQNAAGNVLGNVLIPQTGGWQTWTTVTARAILPAGNQTIRIFARSGLFNINWFEAEQKNFIPGKFEAENYTAINGAGTDTAEDDGGGMDVSWIGDNSWMDYSVDVVTAGIYTFKFRIANGFSDDASIALKSADGTVLGEINNLPRTGGMQSWATTNMTAYLPAGTQTLRVFAKKGIFSLNWFEVAGAKALPGRIEAENYDISSDVRIEDTGDSDGAKNVSYIDDGDFMDYNVNVAAAGAYNFNFRIANRYGDGKIEIKNASGNILGQVDVPRTGDWQTWNTISATATLPAGNQIIRIYANKGAFNFNWFDVSKTNLLPGKVEAENFSVANGTGTENTEDADGGKDVGWIGDNNSMDYNVKVATAGLYTFNFRIANGFSDDASLELRSGNGTVLGQINNLPRTGGMQSWAITSMIASLSAGDQTLRIYSKKGTWSLNWFEATGSKSLPGKIEAEDFDVASAVQSETTGDVDGVKNVSNIDDDDFMDYNVNVANAGRYTFNFRVANSYGEGIIQVKSASGAILGQVDVPRTGGWQNYTTLSTAATLPKGSQVLRIYAQKGTFNFNWFEVVSGAVTPEKSPSIITFADLADKTVGSGPFDLIATSTNTESPVTFSSSNPSAVSVSNETGSWKATIVAAGSAVITASQAESAGFLAAENVTKTQNILPVVSNPESPSTATKITIDPKRWYQLNNTARGFDGLFDGDTQTEVQLGWGLALSSWDAYYPLLDGEEITLESIKFFDFVGDFSANPMTLSVITDQWERIPVATFTGQEYNGWVGPYPNRQLSGDAKFKLDTPIKNIRYLVVNIKSGLPTEMEFYGTYKAGNQVATPVPAKDIKLKDLFGVNAYEWNFEDGNTPWEINETKMTVAKSFSGVRHYMDWDKLESREGAFSYNPTLSGGWNYDAIYERCKAANIEVLACLKQIPSWMQDTYPASERDGENVPVRYGKDFSDPLSYIEQAKVAFQYAARYGSNTAIDPALLSVYTVPRWTNDNPNTIKIGMNVIKYIECDNERDKWWKGRKAYQTAREYAANLSAFYDGHKNTMGPAVGIKNADPNMKVVIAGLVTGSDYVKGMVDWCKEFRGYKADGSVNLCWDVVNFHLYTDNGSSSQSGTSTRGAAPEVTIANTILDGFAKVSHDVSQDMPVWITEAGYDINQESPLKAIRIGAKSALETQGDWILRTSLFSARHGVSKVFFYQMYDDNDGGGMFGTSGLINGDMTRRPAADYFFQVNKVFGEYSYKETTYQDPIVDRYERDGKSLYILTVPDEKGRTVNHTLHVGDFSHAKIYRPKAGSDNLDVEEVEVVAGNINVTVTETPMFVVGSASNARIAATDSAATLASLVTTLPTTETALTLHQSVQVYPNPTAHFISIDVMNKNDSPVEVNMFDAGIGRLHKQLRVNKENQSELKGIDISTLPIGVYIIEIKQGNDRAFRKVIKGL
ncbi:carbohydrate-binding protein [Dyadobacter subterraneus]|uniref:Carbohydrate-binding protein n=1 Tax=Dyadobacter subterraneus TaxID=2773304 RepID=A0ABR9W465_9BACT|nr:carbohydrate-binding protein [Dyadobacter subterraneus]MBE9460253.1 carbohydrate-binding protein [Dyadobacter subterraneus]